MASQFEFKLVGADSPSGELEADQLIAIVRSLKEVAIRLGRAETDAEVKGRPPKRVQRVAKLTIGLAAGSTRVLVRRADDEESLEFDLDEERAFDEKFQSVVESIALDERPDWVTDTLASAAGDLRAALERAAPVVEFAVGGRVRRTFNTADTKGETWRSPEPLTAPESATFVGRLRSVNLDTHRLQVTDDLGNKVALPNVTDDLKAGQLLDTYVVVVGTPELDAVGRLSQIHEAAISPAEPVPAPAGGRAPVSLEDILAAAQAPILGGISGLTDDEAESFLEAIGR